MRWSFCIVLVTLFLCGCAQERADVPGEQRPATEPATQSELSGMQAYELACASCHEAGLDGAPVTGDPAAWSGRSSQWEAVLFEHAKGGYFDMPAKGGMPQLSDRTVSAAAEYMLSITFPNRPLDQ